MSLSTWMRKRKISTQYCFMKKELPWNPSEKGKLVGSAGEFFNSIIDF